MGSQTFDGPFTQFQWPENVQELIRQIRAIVEEGRKEFANKERHECRSLFSNEALWQLREKWVKAGLCLQCVRRGEAARQFTISRVEENNLTVFFQSEFDQSKSFYLSCLANLLRDRIKELHPSFSAELAKQFLPPYLETWPSEHEWIMEALFTGIAQAQIDRFCWHCLSAIEKQFLKDHLSIEEQGYRLRMEAWLQTWPEKDVRVLHMVMAHLFSGMPPQKLQAVLDKKELPKEMEKLIDVYRRILGQTRNKSKTNNRGRQPEDKYDYGYKLAVELPQLSAEEILRRIDYQSGSLKTHSREYKNRLKAMKQCLSDRHEKNAGKRFDWKARSSKKKMAGN
jgi:hypothetical protein